MLLNSISFSTIWIAFVAAPFLILSAVHQKLIPESKLSSRLIRPTKTLSWPEDLVARGKASKDGDAIVIDVTELGYDKVLAKGKITKAFKISAPQFSASAIEKIEELGGEAIEL